MCKKRWPLSSFLFLNNKICMHGDKTEALIILEITTINFLFSILFLCVL